MEKSGRKVGRVANLRPIANRPRQFFPVPDFSTCVSAATIPTEAGQKFALTGIGEAVDLFDALEQGLK
jgi:hypothetical protein